VEYQCEPSYVLVGSVSNTCQIDTLTWSEPAAPMCEPGWSKLVISNCSVADVCLNLSFICLHTLYERAAGFAEIMCGLRVKNHSALKLVVVTIMS